jgi:tetraacyldisaccharide 4'-kinase
MFSNFFLKSFRILLLPFALFYWLGILIRNWLYDHKISRSVSFGLPLVCVGNLSVGGTGKSPMVEYLLRLLKDRFSVATVSRGYKRKTKGYALANATSTALEIGDEPMQFHLKFPDVAVAVGEERQVAIAQLLHDKPDTDVIILDDAFQHRSVRAGLNILLTECANLFTRDFYLPAGDLRDLKSQYKRAEIIVVTKCDPGLSETEKKKAIKEIRLQAHQHIFFTCIRYEDAYHIINKTRYEVTEETEVVLVTGIANPRPLKNWVERKSREYHLLQYSDHHVFNVDDLKDIRKRFESVESPNKIILTTEKDGVRLLKFATEIKDLPMYVLPVRHDFLFGEEQQFNDQVINFIKDFKQKAKK